MKLFAALREDMQQGWIWLQNSNFPPRSIVKIKNPKTKRVIYCEALQIDKNFLAAYNQDPRFNITNPKDSIVINGWYRNKLGSLLTQSEVNLIITPFNSFLGKFMACIYHPQIIVRVAAWLGFISLILGLLGLFLGILSIVLSV